MIPATRVARALLALPSLGARTLLTVVSTRVGPEPASVRTPGQTGERGRWDDQVLNAVAVSPGITIAQAARRVGSSAGEVGATVRRLQHQGLVRATGPSLRLEVGAH